MKMKPLRREGSSRARRAVVRGEAAPAAPAGLHPRTGRLVDVTPAGPRVDFAGNSHGPLLARSIVPLGEAQVARALAAGREVFLSFDGGDVTLPIIVGLLEPFEDPERVAIVDGKRIVLEGRDEIVLKCGKASLTLRRNGRVVVRGAYVETSADGVNRIKGGSVKIN
jgi:hypothetical protein